MQRLTLRNGGAIMIQDRTQENFYTIVAALFFFFLINSPFKSEGRGSLLGLKNGLNLACRI